MKQLLLSSYYKVLASLARRYLAKTKPYIIGINGSVGKTSCRMIITQTLQQTLPGVRIYTSPKNFNGELGMSLSIFGIESYTPSIGGVLKTIVHALKLCTQPDTQRAPQVVVLEYGIDHPGEMEFLLSIAKPHISVHTQIDAVHSLQFGSPEGIAAEEFLLQQHTRETACINVDDSHLAHVLPLIVCDRITYSATHEDTDTIISWKTIHRKQHTHSDDITRQTYGQSATVTFNKKKAVHITIPLLGKYHVAYAAVGVCLADIISYKFYGKEAIIHDTDMNLDVHLQPGRRGVFAGIHDSIIIDSSYNASPGSVKHVLAETTERLHATHPDYQPIFILGEMRELGTQENKEHRGLAEFLLPYVQSGVPLFLVGEAMHTVVKPWLDSALSPEDQSLVSAFPNYAALGESLRDYVTEHAGERRYCLVFKGSQNTIFLEEAVKYMLENPTDATLLTRQGSRRAQKKEDFLRKSLQSNG